MKDRLRNFSKRHIGPDVNEISQMLNTLGYKDVNSFLNDLVPSSIIDLNSINLPDPIDEASALQSLKEISRKNKVFKTFIGQGFYSCHVPAVIKRNVFEDPRWYTSYTPYQPEISQGRLEALINYQTLISDLKVMDV